MRILTSATHAEMTSNQAVVYLGISLLLLIKLLDNGVIPFRNLPSSRHRRIATADLAEYLARKSERRRLIAEAMNNVAEPEFYLPE